MLLNHKTEQRRQDYLDWLYTRSGRTCGLYTGLYQARQRELIEEDMRHTMNTKHDN